MAEKRQTGPAIISDNIVTQSELTMKGKKPNLPDRGFHSLEKSISINDRPSKSKDDFHIKPKRMVIGNAIITINQPNIHTRLKRSVFALSGLYFCNIEINSI